MQHIKAVSGIDWHYSLDGEGECLLFLHGWGVDKGIWRQQVKHFSKIHQVLAIDLPGHGESSFVKTDLDVASSDIDSILNQLSIDEVTVVASSLGGLFALKLYEQHPEKVKRIVFTGSMPKFSISEDYPYGLDVDKIRKLAGQLKVAYPSIVNIFFRSLFTKHERATRRFKWMQKFRATSDLPIQPALVEYLDVLEKEDLRDVLKSVVVPMLFVNGLGDEICTPDTVKYMQTIQPDAEYVWFEKTGHFPFLMKSYEFNEAVENFINA
ncbi:MAG: pimeloyl-ACP methyl ester esterase [Lysobacterales bacterium]|jgi:pimeloyl-ACP methyl ester esterase